MSWLEFLKLNWKKILITVILLLIIPEIIEFLGIVVNNVLFPRDYTKPPELAITLGGPPLWVRTLSNLSLTIISIFLIYYFLKKRLSNKDVFIIILISAILFSAIDFIRYLIVISIEYPHLGGVGTFFHMKIADIFNWIFDWMILPSIYYIIIPSIVILGIHKYFYRAKK